MIGIHDRPGSYSDRWIAYCTERQIAFRRIHCLASDIIGQCDGLDAVLWNWSHGEPCELLAARQVITALERKGVLVFPSTATCGHFDDKISQKYLLEALGAPLIPTWVFWDRDEAMHWIGLATWPKVFKLRCGAGSANVRLVSSRADAESLCRQAFGRGFPVSGGYFNDMRTRLRKTITMAQFWDKVCRAPRTILHNRELRRHLPWQYGYLYFQEFLAGNAYDTRITIIGDRAFGFRRRNRPNDFRASGSGSISYEVDCIDPRCVDIAFRVAGQIGSQSLAFDFLFNAAHEPMIGEVSYGYIPSAVHACEGHWDRCGNWHAGSVWPQDAMLEDVLAALASRSTGPCRNAAA
jgi:glutathione synthase/RimK-type ligase-like ATP-grasp enzyme